jgi:hypothetical protein
MVAPGKPAVITLEPAFITPQDGPAKPDGEQAAATPWMARQAGRYPQVTICGDDLYGKHPWCALWLRHACNFLLVCKPESHPTRYEWLAGVEAAGELQPFAIGRGNGRFCMRHTSRYATDIAVREGEEAVRGNGGELTITQETDGPSRYRQAFATMHHLDRSRVDSVVQAGRARQKIAHEHNHVLKTQG